MRPTNRISVPRIPWKEPHDAATDPGTGGRTLSTEHSNSLRGDSPGVPVRLPGGVKASYKRVRAPGVAKPSALQRGIRESGTARAEGGAAGGKPTLAVDFDGVINSYVSGWAGGKLEDPPMPGAEEALSQLIQHYRMVVFTARYDLVAVRRWLVAHSLMRFFADITNRKPQAVAYLDDKALRFMSWQQALADLL